jgi:hypothetical protein
MIEAQTCYVKTILLLSVHEHVHDIVLKNITLRYQCVLSFLEPFPLFCKQIKGKNMLSILIILSQLTKFYINARIVEANGTFSIHYPQ